MPEATERQLFELTNPFPSQVEFLTDLFQGAWHAVEEAVAQSEDPTLAIWQVLRRRVLMSPPSSARKAGYKPSATTCRDSGWKQRVLWGTQRSIVRRKNKPTSYWTPHARQPGPYAGTRTSHGYASQMISQRRPPDKRFCCARPPTCWRPAGCWSMRFVPLSRRKASGESNGYSPNDRPSNVCRSPPAKSAVWRSA